MSEEGSERAFKAADFLQVQVLTPGELDVEGVFSSGYENEFPRVLKKRGSKAMEEFQAFLNNHKLSSHVWVFSKK
ncbi:hypothetical protein EHQ97_11265 [Leptospira adleri]|nr:hypothetical protein [Leptospira adleri]TGM56508.1 hypothetical protein EHQ97_11265 [Leptospira adleri]